MKKQFILRSLGLLIDLTLMTSLSLTACSTAATPTPTRAVAPTSKPGVPTITKLEPVSYWIQLGYKMEASGDPAAAVDCYNEALRLDPQSYVANFNKGNALVALSKFQEAIRAYDKALAVKNSAEVIHNREIARLLAASVQWPDGPKALEFLEDDLDSPDRKTQLGAALLLFMKCMEKDQTACDILGVAAEQDPSILEDLNKLELPNR